MALALLPAAVVVIVPIAIALAITIRRFRAAPLERPTDGWLWERPWREQVRFWVLFVPVAALAFYVGSHLPSADNLMGAMVRVGVLVLGLWGIRRYSARR